MFINEKNLSKQEKIIIDKISNYLSICKNNSNISYGKLEKKCNITRSMIHTLEGKKGIDINPTIKTLIRVLSCYDKTLLDLFKHVYEEK